MIIKTREFTETETKEIIDLMTACGFELSPLDEEVRAIVGNTSLHFTIPLSDADREKTMSNMGKNHFFPNPTRLVSIFTSYVTSDIRGAYRGYRCRTTTNYHDTSNIFAHSGNGNDNPILNTLLWLEKYSKLEYNVR